MVKSVGSNFVSPENTPQYALSLPKLISHLYPYAGIVHNDTVFLRNKITVIGSHTVLHLSIRLMKRSKTEFLSGLTFS